MHPRQSRAPEPAIGPGGHNSASDGGLLLGLCLPKGHVVLITVPQLWGCLVLAVCSPVMQVSGGQLGGCPPALRCRPCHARGCATRAPVSPCVGGALDDFSQSSAAKGEGT